MTSKTTAVHSLCLHASHTNLHVPCLAGGGSSASAAAAAAAAASSMGFSGTVAAAGDVDASLHDSSLLRMLPNSSHHAMAAVLNMLG